MRYDPTAEYGILVPLTSDEAQSFLSDDAQSVGPHPIQHYIVKYTDASATPFAIFDTFVTHEGSKARRREWGIDDLTSEVEVISSKLTGSGEAGLVNGVKVTFHAVPGKALELREFLSVRPLSLPSSTVAEMNASSDHNVHQPDHEEKLFNIIQSETSTPVWYSLASPNTDQFSTIAFFASEQARKDHLNGEFMKSIKDKEHISGILEELWEGSQGPILRQVSVGEFDVVQANVM